MPRKFLPDALRPVFNATADVDFGPFTSKAIRYSIASWRTIIGRFLTDYLASTWGGPWSIDFELNADGVVFDTGSINGNGVRVQYAISSDGSLAFNKGNTVVPDFPECPILEGTTHEDATISEIYSGGASVVYDFFAPAIEQAGWASATHVWVRFGIGTTGGISYPFICQPSEFQGSLTPGVVNQNFLGIGYAGDPGGNYPTATDEVSLGDGTTSAFLDNSVPLPYFKLSNILTNSF